MLPIYSQACNVMAFRPGWAPVLAAATCLALATLQCAKQALIVAQRIPLLIQVCPDSTCLCSTASFDYVSAGSKSGACKHQHISQVGMGSSRCLVIMTAQFCLQLIVPRALVCLFSLTGRCHAQRQLSSITLLALSDCAAAFNPLSCVVSVKLAENLVCWGRWAASA